MQKESTLDASTPLYRDAAGLIDSCQTYKFTDFNTSELMNSSTINNNNLGKRNNVPTHLIRTEMQSNCNTKK